MLRKAGSNFKCDTVAGGVFGENFVGSLISEALSWTVIQ
jgi:hypothetical protein